MAGEILSRLVLIILLILAQVPATYLVVKFLIYEDGAFGIFKWLRHKAGIREYDDVDDAGNVIKVRRIAIKRWASQVLYCYNCLSPYVCLIVSIAAAHVASFATQFSVGASEINIGEGFGLTLLGVVMWLPVTGLTVMAFDCIGTPS